MRRFTISLMASIAIITANAQNATFENLSLITNAAWNGGPGTISKDTMISSGGCSFRNSYSYDSAGNYSYWSGFGYSNRKDSVSTSYATNELGCIAAEGHGGSTNYGVAYLSFNPLFNKIILPVASKPKSIFITNSTIAYRSMQNGGFGAKAFGGITGNDPDYFRLDITGWSNGIAKTDTVKFYLADFRDTNNVNDYIIKDWRQVDLSALGTCDSLTYNMVSTDTNSFGMLTPSYFCIDNLTFEPLTTEEYTANIGVNAYPNPMANQFTIENKNSFEINFQLISIQGQTLAEGVVPQHSKFVINSSQLPTGFYFLSIVHENKSELIKLTK